MKAVALLPIQKIIKGKYLIGTETRALQVKGSTCMVRTGGGYLELHEYLQHHAKTQCIKLSMYMAKNKTTYKEEVVKLLERNKAPEKVIKDFSKLISPGLEEEFWRNI